MTTELESIPKLTYDQLVNILCILAVRLDRLENLLLDFFEDEQDLFLTTEILKARMELMRHQNKDISFKRFISTRTKELDESFKGFLKFYHESQEEKKPQSKWE